MNRSSKRIKNKKKTEHSFDFFLRPDILKHVRTEAAGCPGPRRRESGIETGRHLFSGFLSRGTLHDGEILVLSVRIAGFLVMDALVPLFHRIRCRYMKPGEEGRVIGLIVEVFKHSVAPGYSPEGVSEFLKYARSDDLLKRSRSDHFILVAQAGHDIVAMIEIKKYHHIALFFVAGAFQRKGIGKTLLKRALKICRDRDPWLREISVNASPNAVGAYEQMGFEHQGPARTINGIRFFPMVVVLRKSPFFS